MPQFPSLGYRDIISLKSCSVIPLESDYTKQGQRQGGKKVRAIWGIKILRCQIENPVVRGMENIRIRT